ncbi:sialyltransferase-like protein 5 isoform X1 [Magnolia sinica]|uniref:sialyltransferase-like protein 5 isoform X1 n=1 Tax=Magnolia sinica TaxID=86752 RepID=UPI00265B5198|nr:sialyltransferase-like protein 5 isoform X1 [Magnolia sinica]
MKAGKGSYRRPTVLLLVFAVVCFCIILLSIQSSFFTGSRKLDLSRKEEVLILSDFQSRVQQCVASRGLGLTAHIVDHCKLVLKFPEGTNSTWYNEQFKIYEPLEYNYDVCEAILLWEQYRNMTTVLTREYLDARPDGWLEYAAKRIAQLGSDKCYNRSLCEEHLNLILPPKPPFHPRQFKKCAVVGNSGDLLKTEFGQEIDGHDAVIRDNEAPVNEKYARYVGLKRDFRLVVRGAARNMVTILNGSDDEVLIIKSVTHRDFNAMIKEIPNPVYLFQGIVLRRGAKGTGMKSVELALSMCDIVDIYGFTVDPGYTEWTRYFSTPRKGHNPLQGRAYYQLLECLGVIRIHSPMRSKRKQDWSDVPSREVINRAQSAALHLKRYQAGQADGLGPFSSCKVWGNAGPDGSGPVSGSADMSEKRKKSNYSKWEVLPFESLRKEAQEHYIQMGGVSLYKMDGNKLDDLVCVRHSLKSEA